MNVSMPEISELDALLRLLDDDAPEVRAVVAGRFGELGGDLSELLPCLERTLSGKELEILTELLRAGRRAALREDWQMPAAGVGAMEEDWEFFESQLRLLSDYLHDGVTLRQPLSDALDLLADEFSEKYPHFFTEDDLRMFLFCEGRMKPNRNDYHDPRNGDLAWCVAEGVSNPIGLGLIYILVARRLGLVVEGICFPGHFLCRIYEDGLPFVIDCFDEGRLHAENTLTDPENGLTKDQRAKLREKADLGTILLRILNNLVNSFERLEQVEDAELIVEIRDSMLKLRLGE